MSSKFQVPDSKSQVPCPRSKVPRPSFQASGLGFQVSRFRYRRCWGASIVLAAALAVPLAQAQDIRDARVDEAVKRGVAYLMSQQRQDGSISDGRYPTAITALSIMAICASGHPPSEKSREGEVVRRALEYVLQDERVEKGYFGERDHSRMYGHGITSLMLAETIGMGADKDQDIRVRDRLKQALDIIYWSQERKGPHNKDQYGGWRYQPKDADSDLSITIWQVMALRAAKNAGMEVPKSVIDKAVEYIKRCYRSDRDDNGRPKDLKSACGYQPTHAPRFASAAAGLRALQVCGEYGALETTGSAVWLKEHKPQLDERFFYYGMYYYAQAMYQQGNDYAKEARAFVETTFLEKQKPDGSWESADGQERDAGITYATSMALLSLSVKYHYLPLFER